MDIYLIKHRTVKAVYIRAVENPSYPLKGRTLSNLYAPLYQLLRLKRTKVVTSPLRTKYIKDHGLEITDKKLIATSESYWRNDWTHTLIYSGEGWEKYYEVMGKIVEQLDTLEYSILNSHLRCPRESLKKST